MKPDAKPTLSSFAEIMAAANAISEDAQKRYDEFISQFDALRNLKDLSNTQIDTFFDLVESKLDNVWISFLTKLTVKLCQTTHDRDSKLINAIRTRCKRIFDMYKILDTELTSAEKAVCLSGGDGSSVTKFLQEAQKQNQKCELQIPNATLACLTYICFSLYRKSLNASIGTQILIDRAIAEYFSAPELSGVKEKDLVGKTLGTILANKAYSPKRISELTYLYSGSSKQLMEQAEQIRNLNEIRKDQMARINSLSTELIAERARNQELHAQMEVLKSQAQAFQAERDAAENMLDYEKNKYEKQLDAQGADLAEQLYYDIGLELEALRELVDHLDLNNQRRFLRRLDRMDRYLREFGGEE